MNLLNGKKLKLRALEPEDIDLLMEWENDSRNWEVSNTLSPYSRALLKQYIQQSHLDIYKTGQLRFMIQDLETKQSVGAVDLFEFDGFHQRAGVGILIGKHQMRNNGYATEALKLIKDYSFLHLGLRQLFCNILEDNKASLKLFQKEGFEITGTMKAWVRSGEHYKDQFFLQLFKGEE